MKMQIAKNKVVTIAIAIFFMFSMGASMMLVPSASAHTPAWNTATYAYISATPNPVGVGQQVTVYMWLDNVFGAGFEAAAYAQLTNNYRFHNYNLTVVAPDGSTNTTIFSFISDPTSSQYTYIYPTQVGTYTLIFNFPGQAYNQYPGEYYAASVEVNDTYLPSIATTTLTVQQAAIPGPTGSSPLPTAFWTRPIYGSNNIWYTISSNWLGDGSPVISATGSGDLSGFNEISATQVYPGDAVGPTTGHVMWTYPLEAGGVVGGISTDGKLGDTYNEGSAYEQKFNNPIIMDGDIFYRATIGSFGSGGLFTSGGAEVCQNLETGQIVWTSQDMPTISFGYLYDHQDPNQHGEQSGILFTGWGASLVFDGFVFSAGPGEAFDAATGDWLFNVTNSPSGSAALGPSGEQLIYSFANDGNTTNPQWDLREWNSSRLWNTIGIGATDILTPTLYNASSTNVPATSTTTTTGVAATSTAGLVSIPVVSPTLTGPYTHYSNVYDVNGGIDNANSPFDRFDWNVSVNSWYAQYAPFAVESTFYNNMLICVNGTFANGTPQVFATYSTTPYTYFAVNLNATVGPIGEVLWTHTVQPPAGNLTVTYAGADPTASDGLGHTGVFAEAYQENQEFVGYSMTTGAQIWGPTAPQAALDYYGNPIYPFIATQPAYGNLYSSSYAGIVYANSMTTGQLLWTYGNGPPGSDNSTNAGFNTPYGDYPTMIQAIGNGYIYLVTGEHTVDSPIYKGCVASCINAQTGQLVWTLSNDNNMFADMSYAIADGYAVTWNGYDNSIYSIGQGPSATTVTAPDVGLPFGTPVVIQGTVMDVSPGTKQTEQAADFPNGVPVASDSIMQQWMGYVYQQQPLPTNFAGVQVNIAVVDSNNNYYSIGNATTTSSGTYSLTWTPIVPGSYSVIATFEGTHAYWPSFDQTAFTVMKAPTATAAPTATPTSVADLYFVPSIVGLFVLIIVVAIVLALLMLRKKKA